MQVFDLILCKMCACKTYVRMVTSKCGGKIYVQYGVFSMVIKIFSTDVN